MRIFNKVINIVLLLIVIFLLTSTIGTTITKKPVLMTAVRSNSMYPLYERGDLLFLSPVSIEDKLQTRDIIIFKAESGSLASKGWVAHRIIGGNHVDGYITKGDANDYNDQERNDPKIEPEWISNKVITISGHPLKLPLIGQLPLLAEKYQKNPYILPFITVILATVLVVSEMTRNKKKDKRNNKYELALMYFLGGITISIMLGASMVATSEHLRVPYEVSETSQGVMMGSDVGVLKLGEVVERPLSDLNNKGFFPVSVIISSNDKQTTFSHKSLTLKPGQGVKATMKVTAQTPGKYESSIHVGMFFPLLPKALISTLAQINYWLAVVVVSIIPGLPLMLYPIFERRMRKSVLKEINRSVRKIRNFLSFS